ncbi:hypothetical protein ACNHKD_12735 [Methylocystis sp. JAN1]|uniref:hypothetical protein n=1 Tax=Methylocystis sp. JAN1 TaxID=3397211 RepID=UPI003FA1EA5E
MPAGLTYRLFFVGWTTADELRTATRSARPRPTTDEFIKWISAARETRERRALDVLLDAVEWGDETPGDEIEWAASRIAREGFDQYFKEGR